MKTIKCSKGKRSDFRNYQERTEYYLSLSLFWMTPSRVYKTKKKSWYVLLSPSKFFYEHPINVIPFFRSFSEKIPLDIHSEHPTLFITILDHYMKYTNKFSIPNIQSHHSDFLLRSPVQMSGVWNGLRRKVRHPLNQDKHIHELFRLEMCGTKFS